MSNTAKAKLIRKLQTPAGGWTKQSLAKLGVSWPPPPGWKKQLEAGHSEEYTEYLRSSEWREKRRLVLERARSAARWGHPKRTIDELSAECERCHAVFLNSELEVHHLTYDHLGDEPLEDLLALCGLCHSIKDRERKQAVAKQRDEQAMETFLEKKYGEDYWLNDTGDPDDPRYREARRWLARKRGCHEEEL